MRKAELINKQYSRPSSLLKALRKTGGRRKSGGNKKNILTRLFIVYNLFLMVGYVSAEELKVQWLGSSSFKKYFEQSPIGMEEGRLRVKALIEENSLYPPKYKNAPNAAAFVYDNYIFYSNELKGKVHLGGYYLNVDSLDVEYRRTNDSAYLRKNLF